MSQTPQAQAPQSPTAQPQAPAGGRGQASPQGPGAGRGQGPGAGRGQAPGAGRGQALETLPPTGNIDTAFEALKQIKAGEDLTPLIPIARAAGALSATPASRAALEGRLTAALAPSYSPAARTYVLRQLTLIATTASVAAVAPLVMDDELSFFARNVLEHIPGPEPDRALREGLGKTKRATRIGIINSIAVRRDGASVPMLVRILSEDPQSAAAAARALGEIGTPEAVTALMGARGKGPTQVQQGVTDGLLIAADRLIEAGQRSQAVSVLQLLTDSSQPEHIRAAASRTISATLRP